MHIIIYIFCQLSVTVYHVCCTRRPNLELPEHFQDKWPKHVGAWCDKYEDIVQPVGGEICVY